MPSPAFCTIFSKNYLAHVRTLAQSIRRFHPDATVYALLADRVDGYFDPTREPFHLIELDQAVPENLRIPMTFYYTPFELCNALKPFLHKFLAGSTQEPQWLYLDSDIYVLNQLDPILDQLSRSSILLKPHTCTPVPFHLDDPRAPLETRFLRYGIYNGGFLGLRPTGDTHAFLDWWQARLTLYCRFQPGLFVDQLWLNLVPLFFNHVALCQHPGANLSYWNIHEGEFSADSGHKVHFRGTPVLFYHFSGWDMDHPTQVSRALPHRGSHDWFAPLGLEYRDRLLANGYNDVSRYPYAFSEFKTGEAIQPQHRQLWWDLTRSDAARPPNPFESYGLFAKDKHRPTTWQRLVTKFRSS